MADRVHGSATLARHQRIARAFVRILGHVEATGLASIPADGPTLLAINHRSMLDGPLVFGMINRPVACLVKAEAFTAGVGRLLRTAGQISVVRDVIDPAPIRLCLRILQAGGVIGIFPEGTRGDGTAQTAKPGVGYFALRTGATVIPVACWGTAEAARTPRWVPIRVHAGPALRFDRYPESRPLNRRVTAAATERIRQALFDLVSTTRPQRPTQEFAGRHGA
jgi:1-acyl-sn-glycerol-3-phosphate acyltransferase